MVKTLKEALESGDSEKYIFGSNVPLAADYYPEGSGFLYRYKGEGRYPDWMRVAPVIDGVERDPVEVPVESHEEDKVIGNGRSG